MRVVYKMWQNLIDRDLAKKWKNFMTRKVFDKKITMYLKFPNMTFLCDLLRKKIVTAFSFILSYLTKTKFSVYKFSNTAVKISYHFS